MVRQRAPPYSVRTRADALQESIANFETDCDTSQCLHNYARLFRQLPPHARVEEYLSADTLAIVKRHIELQRTNVKLFGLFGDAVQSIGFPTALAQAQKHAIEWDDLVEALIAQRDVRHARIAHNASRYNNHNNPVQWKPDDIKSAIAKLGLCSNSTSNAVDLTGTELGDPQRSEEYEESIEMTRRTSCSTRSSAAAHSEGNIESADHQLDGHRDSADHDSEQRDETWSAWEEALHDSRTGLQSTRNSACEHVNATPQRQQRAKVTRLQRRPVTFSDTPLRRRRFSDSCEVGRGINTQRLSDDGWSSLFGRQRQTSVPSSLRNTAHDDECLPQDERSSIPPTPTWMTTNSDEVYIDDHASTLHLSDDAGDEARHITHSDTMPAAVPIALTAADADAAFEAIAAGRELPLPALHIVLRLLAPPNWHVVNPGHVAAGQLAYHDYELIPESSLAAPNLLIPIRHHGNAAVDEPAVRWSLACCFRESACYSLDGLGQAMEELGTATNALLAFLASVPQLQHELPLTHVGHLAHPNDQSSGTTTLILRGLFTMARAPSPHMIDDSIGAKLVLAAVRAVTPADSEHRAQTATAPEAPAFPNIRSPDEVHLLPQYFQQLRDFIRDLEAPRLILGATVGALRHVTKSLDWTIATAQNRHGCASVFVSKEVLQAAADAGRVRSLQRRRHALEGLADEVDGLVDSVHEADIEAQKSLTKAEAGMRGQQ
ncbi:hypothetical protein Slin15195_G129380 [Septoria linicola]|uniref:Uncharacterized protein n=1 Tax=Septoria linicola TaxID=215465 RepID=A0A9Q9B261_9PEZI|nr:hypothetical protein Slin14017_G121910 [Septoria linicola]USW59619.1 hypothetical protein Slin15195_G129380 [Septoria linicola]